MDRRLASLLLLFSLALSGCGNQRTPARGLFQPAAPVGLRHFNLPSAGMAFQTPRNWTTSFNVRAPLVMTVSSGAAVAALWLFPRRTGLPHTRTQLGAARAQLIKAAKSHDPRLQLIRSAVGRVDGYPAVELDALEHDRGQLRRVRSVHVFAASREVVLDAYAPPGSFHFADHAVFSPLKRSLQLRTPSAA